jgi:hypothetical protein
MKDITGRVSSIIFGRFAAFTGSEYLWSRHAEEDLPEVAFLRGALL